MRVYSHWGRKWSTLLLLKIIAYNIYILNNFYKNNINCLYIIINIYKFYIIFTNLRLSSLYYYPQSLDNFSYKQIYYKKNIIVTTIYLTNLQTLIILYTTTLLNNIIHSLENLYYNFWWFEREIIELSGIFFKNKRDVRNLLLEYNNIYKPMLKEFPSIGIYELFYNFIYNTHTHIKLSIQI